MVLLHLRINQLLQANSLTNLCLNFHFSFSVVSTQMPRSVRTHRKMLFQTRGSSWVHKALIRVE